jgi:hypothetical protein
MQLTAKKFRVCELSRHQNKLLMTPAMCCAAASMAHLSLMIINLVTERKVYTIMQRVYEPKVEVYALQELVLS